MTTVEQSVASHSASAPRLARVALLITALRNRWGMVALLLIAAILTILYFRWLGYDLNTIGTGLLGFRIDAPFNCWTIYQAYDNLAHHLTQLGYAPIFAGDANTFNHTIAPYGIAIVTLPVYLLTGQNIVLTYNLYLFATYIFTALSVYWLVRYLVGAPAIVGILIGLFVAFVPYRIFHLGHIESLSMQFFFFTLYCFHRLLDRPGWRWGIAVSILFCLTILTSGYLGLIVLVGCAMLLIVLLVRRPAASILTRRLMVTGVGVAVLVVVLLTPFVISRLGNASFSQGYTLGESIFYSSSPLGWFSSLALIYRDVAPYQGEGTVFLGATPIVLAILAYRLRLRSVQIENPERSAAASEAVTQPLSPQPPLQGGSPNFPLPLLVGAYTVMLIVGYVLSLGPVASLGSVGQIPLPYLLLLQIPGFSYIRVPARYIMLAITGYAVLGAYTLTVLYRLPHRLLVWTTLGIVACFIFVESVPQNGGDGSIAWLQLKSFNAASVHPDQTFFTNSDAYQWLAAQPAGSVSFHYPPGDGNDQQVVTEQYVFDQIQYKQPIINGWGSTLPSWYMTTDWAHFPNESSLDVLRQRHTKFVLIHPDKFIGDEQAAFTDRLAPYLADGTLTLVQQFESVTVYALK